MALDAPSCTACGSMTDGEHKEGCPTQAPPVITDKRGTNKKPDEAKEPQPIEVVTTEPSDSEFARQQAEWDAMTDEEKQEILARQAADLEPTPYSGAGIETPHEPGKQSVISYFAVIIMEDGTSLATDNMDVSGYEKKFDIDGAKMHRACSEIIKDIETTDTAVQVMLYMKQQAGHAMAQQRNQALQQQLEKRGVPRGRRGR